MGDTVDATQRPEHGTGLEGAAEQILPESLDQGLHWRDVTKRGRRRLRRLAAAAAGGAGGQRSTASAGPGRHSPGKVQAGSRSRAASASSPPGFRDAW